MTIIHRHPCGHQVDFVQHEHHMLVRLFALEKLLHMYAARAYRITCIDYLQEYIAAVDHLCEK